MVLQRLFRVGAILTVATLLLTACNNSINSFTFQSDQQLEANFQTHKTEFAELLKFVQNCGSPTERKRYVELGETAFYICPVSGSQLNSLKLKEVAYGNAFGSASKDRKTLPTIFVVDQTVDDFMAVFVEEKGYIFSPVPIQKELLEQGTLDQFVGKQIVERRSIREIWKYKKINDGWYLYFRQYFQDFLP